MSAGPARIGLLLPSREVALWAGGDPSVLVEGAVAAEAAGFDSVWVGDSLLARPRAEPLTVLAAVAARTRSVRLGTAVLLPLLRHPLSAAHTLATLERLAPGRLVLGVAPGSDVAGTHAELAAVGMRSRRRVTDLVEIVDRWRTIWRDQDPDAEVSPRPTTPAGPPVWLAAHGPRMLGLTGALFDGWLPFSPSVSAYREGLDKVRSAAAAAGRPPDDVTAAAYLTVAVDPSAAVARDALDEYMLGYYGLPAAVMRGVQACHAGPVDSAVEWVQAYVDAGAREIVIRVAAPRLQGWDQTVAAVLGALRSG